MELVIRARRGRGTLADDKARAAGRSPSKRTDSIAVLIRSRMIKLLVTVAHR